MYICNFCGKQFNNFENRKYGGHIVTCSENPNNNKRKKFICDKLCLVCGDTLSDNSKKFCSHTCSAKYNNTRRKLSTETKNKISKTLKSKIYSRKTKICPICEVEYRGDAKSCSVSCGRKLSWKNNRNKFLLAFSKRDHPGWKSRKGRESFPEKFVSTWLIDNGILGWEREKAVKRTDCRKCYFLDFFWKDLNLNLEIDGRQHTDRIEKDKERDKFLLSVGIEVVRVHWIGLHKYKEQVKLLEDFRDEWFNKN